MAVPVITLLNHTELDDADDNTGWNDLTTADSDIKVEGGFSMSGIFRADGEQAYYDHGSAPSTGAGKTLRGWISTNNLVFMGTMAGDPYKILCYDGSTTELKDLFGSDTYPGGWFNFIWDMDDFTTLTLANVQRWGIECGHDNNAKNAINSWMDVLRYLDGYSMTGGTSPDKVELSDIAIYDKGTTTLRGYNILSEVSSVFFCTGAVQFGEDATTHYFEMDGEIIVFKDEHVAAGLYSLSGVGSGTDVVIQNSVIKSAGSTDATRFIFNWSDADLASCSIIDNLIVKAAASTFKSGQAITGNTFDDCSQITHGGADMDDCVFKNYEGAADSSYLIYNEAADPNGEMDNTEFTKGTAETHAIEFGTSSPTTMTLTGIAFSGYNAADDQTNSTLYFARTSGTITVNLSGCTGNISYKAAGTTVVNFVADPVTCQVTVKDINTQAVLEDARVLLVASDATGDFPYQESVTEIVRVTDTATVEHTGHGLVTGDFALIDGADQDEYNGAYEITVSTADFYTYIVGGTPTTPATGTIISTGGYFNTLTNVSGIVTDSRTISADQPVTGRARLSTAPDLYKSSPINETVDKDNGLSVTVYLIPDS